VDWTLPEDKERTALYFITGNLHQWGSTLRLLFATGFDISVVFFTGAHIICTPHRDKYLIIRLYGLWSTRQHANSLTCQRKNSICLQDNSHTRVTDANFHGFLCRVHQCMLLTQLEWVAGVLQQILQQLCDSTCQRDDCSFDELACRRNYPIPTLSHKPEPYFRRCTINTW